MTAWDKSENRFLFFFPFECLSMMNGEFPVIGSLEFGLSTHRPLLNNLN
jgi:hypothetical protein